MNALMELYKEHLKDELFKFIKAKVVKSESFYFQPSKEVRVTVTWLERVGLYMVEVQSGESPNRKYECGAFETIEQVAQFLYESNF